MTYRERRIARAEHLQMWAEKREAKADGYRAQAQQHIDMVPMGQPILVDHYSAPRARRDQAHFIRHMDLSIEHSDKAEEMRSKATNILAAVDRSIYSDDSDAIERLQAKLTELEAERDRIKAYNASCRKGAPDTNLLDDKQRRNLESSKQYSPMFIGKNGEMPGYALTNLSGNINRTKKRLEALKRSGA